MQVQGLGRFSGVSSMLEPVEPMATILIRSDVSSFPRFSDALTLLGVSVTDGRDPRRKGVRRRGR